MTLRPKFTGTCRFCGCSASEDESKACTTPTGDACHWWDWARTVCSAPACVRAWEQERAKRKAELEEKSRKKTPAEIHALIAGRGRKHSTGKKAGAA